MKKALTIAVLTATTLGLGVPAAHAKVNVDLNLNIFSPAAAYAAPPPHRHHRRYFHRRPDFLYTPRLGFSVSLGGPHDMLLYGGRYYIYDNGAWYWSSRYDGPWRYIEHRRLPRNIRQYRRSEIRRYRDAEYRRRYRRDWRDRDERRGPDRDHWR
ncbi:hypothetical protein EST62_07540 [Chlorobaculum sp. 24CR]|uniref:hypothetical protein n=1 Tax=Chlorobaculum sp. 24CR TaxID=2508878 RepID=UPI00100B3174|nr:hypothetical protein [Chlorobaculum sp. 24CR]RXK85129.1 hypothetical protein EST62_07540 [Chlorobaculum sp. 24CR]